MRPTPSGPATQMPAWDACSAGREGEDATFVYVASQERKGNDEDCRSAADAIRSGLACGFALQINAIVYAE
jgi:hypothetical protein